MSNPFVVAAYFADQGDPQDWGTAKQFTTKPAKLYYLTANNKSASTVYIQLYDSASGASGTPREIPLPAGQVIGWSQLNMRAGIYVRAVTAANGSSLIGANDVKFDCGYTDQVV